VRSAVITGVSRGLGAALFDEFHAAGDRVLALGRRFSAAQHAAARTEPHRIRLRHTDLTDPASLPGAAELAAFLDEGAGPGHDGGTGEVVLVHNAAVFEPFGPIGALGAEQLAAAVAVNLTAPMLLTNSLFAGDPIPAEPAGATGRAVTVLFISSSAAHRVGGGRSVYGSTKRAGEMFFMSLGEERAGDPRVRIVVVDPGIMDTGMQAVVRQHARDDAYFPGRERFVDRYDRGELPAPADVARRIMKEHFG
jgi:NAD(P)-dependent dehydrogenase (short-subunit alcohol dehydrogenase family)